MELLESLTDGNVIMFLLLFVRFTSVLAFFPFFDNSMLLVGAKAALGFYLTILFFPLIPETTINFTVTTFTIAILSEILIGFLASVFLQIVFHMLSFAGELISFVMGFSLASSFDPISGTQKPIIGQLLVMLAVMIMLAADLHHLFLLFVDRTLDTVPLGGFVLNENILDYTIKATSELFLMGFTIAFPIIALIIFSDIIFGMIMKTNPQFNILVVGFPIKIAVAMFVITVIIPSVVLIFKREFIEAFNALEMFVSG